MKIVLIGSGNVSTVFGKLLKAGGHTITAVVSRNAAHAAQLGSLLQTDWYNDIKKINTDTDVYIIAASDDAIREIASEIKAGKKIILHTSGSVSKDVLGITAENYGVLYPLQSLRKGINYNPEIPLLIDASNKETFIALEMLASSISQKVSMAGDAKRLKLHVAAVISANFSNHLYALTEEFCQKENVRFDMLIPLIQKVAQRLNDYSARDVQTGPAVRNDQETIQTHLQILNKHPQIKKIYESFTESILNFYNK